ncbi:MAG TPA: HAD-IIIA family hydrolase [Crocinitomix sp.]|nr:HAD-IIIA family hydrolase [Crocinitomix sp.]
MSIYNDNLRYLLEKKDISISEFENIILIPKIKIIEPSPEELVRIADYFDISIDTLLKIKTKNLDKVLNRDIKLLILDVDGTMTDGGMYFSENGDQIKKYNTKDGMAIKYITKKGIQVGIISHGYKINMVQQRAELLGIQKVYVGREDKTKILKQWCEELKITLNQVAYIGDDVNDKAVMEVVGLSACPKNAVKSIKKIADVILTKNGGDACVREFIDEYIAETK